MNDPALVRPLARVYVRCKYEMHPVCCDAMATAFQSCTDNEGYGALAHYYAFPDDLHFGSDLPAVRFCPWCGTARAAGPAP